MQSQEEDLSSTCCCCTSERNRTTGKSYYWLSVCLKKIDQITSPILGARSFLKQRFGLLQHPLCYLEQRGVRADDSRLQKFLASKYLMLNTSPFVHWGWVHIGWSTFLHVSVLDLDQLEKDTFILQKRSLFFAHFKEVIFIKRSMN